MEFMTTTDAAKKWGIKARRVRQLLIEGRIDGAVKNGHDWNIPYDATKPIDKRLKAKNNHFIIDLPKEYFKKIDEKKELLNKKRPLSPNTIKSLRESNILEWTYNSNAIEGNTLTLKETKVVLEGITIGGKSIEEHLEVTNHKEAIGFLEDLVNKNNILTEWAVKNIHRLILKTIDNSNAGIYRKENVIISGATHRPPEYVKVPEEMKNLMYMYASFESYHPIIKAALLHGEFVKVHPFIDGNGRTARLLMNFEIMKHGYPPVIIKKEIRSKYYDALDKAHITNNYTDFIKLIAISEEEMLDKYLEII